LIAKTVALKKLALLQLKVALTQMVMVSLMLMTNVQVLKELPNSMVAQILTVMALKIEKISALVLLVPKMVKVAQTQTVMVFTTTLTFVLTLLV